MGMLAPFIWPVLFGSMLFDTMTFLFVPRDFSGKDGCADDRKFPIA